MVEILSQKLDERAYKNAVLYFIKYCNNQYLHATKLNKLLYYLDFIYFRDHQKSITGDTYIHQGYGPVPTRIDEVLAKLKSEGAIDTEAVPPNDVEMINFNLKDESKFDESVFSSAQKNFSNKFVTNLEVGRQKKSLLRHTWKLLGFTQSHMRLLTMITRAILISFGSNALYLCRGSMLSGNNLCGCARRLAFL